MKQIFLKVTDDLTGKICQKFHAKGIHCALLSERDTQNSLSLYIKETETLRNMIMNCWL